ncbi:hypothetical protein OEA41_000980 [Lepraria neglecta]|uniref:Uncharacterized protein n=1 Tax=Lepraria neglecta TaxID=209136 RepID=A0AAE0DRN4_9LECA|nr:hypothetical protein OEA41_000980 [Lepraria neglecta]
MPLEQTAPVLNDRKRKLSIEEGSTTVSSLSPPTKRRKQVNQQQHRTPSSFWDNLSRQWLTRRALREFDRRTVPTIVPVPLDRSGKENICLAQLKRLARHGGPSLGDLRAYPEPQSEVPPNRSMASSQSGSRKRAKTGQESDISSRTRKSSAYDPAFAQHLIDHGVYPHGYGGVRNVQEPHNWEEIQARLAKPRASLSPSRFTREAFLDFTEKNEDALTEGKVMSKVFPIIAGTADIPSQENLPFGNLKDLTDGSITKAQPDFYDGSRPADLKKCIREELGQYIVPSTNTAAPCVPNFFTDGKGPNGNTAVCKRQALYDGALGARGIHELRSHVDPHTAYDNNAYTITSTYHGGTGDLTIYTTHPTRPNDAQTLNEYRMIQLRGWKLTDTADTFRQGASALRNARDWANEKREELIAAANDDMLNTEPSGPHSSVHSFVSLPLTEFVQQESDTSADELAIGTDTCARSMYKTPVGARASHSSKICSQPRKGKKPIRLNGGYGTCSGGSPKIEDRLFLAMKMCMHNAAEDHLWR